MNSQNRILKHYDEKYEKTKVLDVVPVPLVKYPKSRTEMAAKVISKYKGKYLEIGAGSGNLALTALNYYDELVLTEISQSRVNILKKLFKDKNSVQVVFHNIDEEVLKYPDNHFDCICMTAVIEHLIEPIRVLNELNRVLKPGGCLIVDTPNIAKITRRVKLLMGYFPATASLQEGLIHYDKMTQTDLFDEGHFHYFTFRSLARLCKERANFSRVNYLGYGSIKTMKVPYFLSWLYPSLFSEVFIIASK